MTGFGKVAAPAQIPANQKLWSMLINQAKHRFRVYPSMAASHWVHSEYVKQGGQFVKSQKDTHEGKHKAARKRSEEARKKNKKTDKD